MNTKSEIVLGDLLAGIVPFVKREEEGYAFRMVTYQVHGFWGICYFKIYQERCIKTGDWLEPTIDWSVGGRDRKQEPNHLKSTMCFALALQDAVEHAAKMTEKVVTE